MIFYFSVGQFNSYIALISAYYNIKWLYLLQWQLLTPNKEIFGMSVEKRPKIALCRGIVGIDWTNRMIDALDNALGTSSGEKLWDVVDINKNGWIETLLNYDAILWPPGCMGIKPSSHLKEKIYFLEKHMGKLIMPNFETVWHFESKVAQSFIFNYYNIPTPRTVVSFSLDDALSLLRSENYPVVFKSSSDAASRGVRLVKDKKRAQWYAWKALYTGLGWRIIRRALKLDHRDNVAYWQEFIPNNERDLRVTAIGDRCAVAFWRKNRPGDFRASGSGRIVYTEPAPEETIRFAMETNKKLGFDSMGYDFIFREGKFVITEMSYTYVDSAIHNATGYYRKLENGDLEFITGQFWPQEFWVSWFINRIKLRFGNDCLLIDN
jgi:glutathione synthase/RimK-type ligase-like ATP-grasp enzyme